VIPYGIYDLGRNEGWVSVGIDHDTAEFAIDSILAWWKHMGSKAYPNRHGAQDQSETDTKSLYHWNRNIGMRKWPSST